MKTISEGTTLAELEVILRSFGLECVATVDPDGARAVYVEDSEAIDGAARGSTLAEAMKGAIDNFILNKFGVADADGVVRS